MHIKIKRKQQKNYGFLLELLIKRRNSRYERTRLVGKQSDAFFRGDGVFVEDENFFISVISLGT